MPRRPAQTSPRPVAIAHRGGSEEAPENSMAAFEAATRLGYGHLETDVHLSSDGVLVAFHDDCLDRVTDRTGVVAQLPLAEIRRARIAGTEQIPTLDELLEAFPQSCLNIDMKSDDTVVPLVSTLRRHDAMDRVCIASFSDDRLRRVRKLIGPDVRTAAGPREIAAVTAAARVRGSGRSGGGRPAPAFDCLQVPVRHLNIEIITAAFVARAHALGCEVHAWTIDDPAEMDRLFDLGVDGIITDRPSALKDVLVRRGSWQ